MASAACRTWGRWKLGGASRVRLFRPAGEHVVTADVYLRPAETAFRDLRPLIYTTYGAGAQTPLTGRTLHALMSFHLQAWRDEFTSSGGPGLSAPDRSAVNDLRCGAG